MNKLKFLRAQKNITQDQIAKDLFINQKTYSRYETGVSEPDYATLKKIANYFDVTTDYLLDNENEEFVMISKEDFKQLIKASKIIDKIRNTYNISDN